MKKLRDSDTHNLNQLWVATITTKALQLQVLRWIKSSARFVILNFYGCFGNPDECGGGEVIRNDMGDLIAGFSNYYLCRTNMMAEVKADLNGVKLGLKLQLPIVMVESDSRIILDWWHGRGDVYWAIRESICQLTQASVISFSHVFREVNKVAEVGGC